VKCFILPQVGVHLNATWQRRAASLDVSLPKLGRHPSVAAIFPYASALLRYVRRGFPSADSCDGVLTEAYQGRANNDRGG
jgi:hypothetical protein